MGIGDDEPGPDHDPGPPPERRTPSDLTSGPEPDVAGLRRALAATAAAPIVAASTAAATSTPTFASSAAPTRGAFAADSHDGGGHPGGDGSRRFLQLFDQ